MNSSIGPSNSALPWVGKGLRRPPYREEGRVKTLGNSCNGAEVMTPARGAIGKLARGALEKAGGHGNAVGGALQRDQ